MPLVASDAMNKCLERARMLRFAAVALTASTMLGCQARATPDALTGTRNVLLSTTLEESSDTLVRALVTRQREVLRLLGTADAGELAGYLDLRFVWNPDPKTAAGGFPPQGDANYFAMLAGYRPSILTGMPEAFAVYPMGENAAQVFAELPGGHGGIVTFWDFRSGVWKATMASNSDFNLVGWRGWLNKTAARTK